MREICLQLPKSLVLRLCAFALRHIDVRSDHFDSFSIRGKQWVARRLDIFDCSIEKHDSELEYEISFLTQGLINLCTHSLAIIWMDPLENSFPVGEPLLRI